MPEGALAAFYCVQIEQYWPSSSEARRQTTDYVKLGTTRSTWSARLYSPGPTLHAGQRDRTHKYDRLTHHPSRLLSFPPRSLICNSPHRQHGQESRR